MAWLVHVVSVMYDEVSGGLISKPMTYPHHVIQAFEERIERDVNEAVAEERARIIEELQWSADWQKYEGRPLAEAIDRVVRIVRNGP
jgi:hypothetical protein